MAKTVLGIQKQVVEVSLTDDEDSPTFRLDLSDDSVQARARALYDRYLTRKPDIDAALAGGEADHHALAAFYEDIITELLGEDAFHTIVAYVRDAPVTGDETADGIVLLLSPVVTWLVDQLALVLGTTRRKVREKYLGTIDDGREVI